MGYKCVIGGGDADYFSAFPITRSAYKYVFYFYFYLYIYIFFLGGVPFVIQNTAAYFDVSTFFSLHCTWRLFNGNTDVKLGGSVYSTNSRRYKRHSQLAF